MARYVSPNGTHPYKGKNYIAILDILIRKYEQLLIRFMGIVRLTSHSELFPFSFFFFVYLLLHFVVIL